MRCQSVMSALDSFGPMIAQFCCTKTAFQLQYRQQVGSRIWRIHSESATRPSEVRQGRGTWSCSLVGVGSEQLI